jgi:RNA polymerase sigma-70 factor (ECF subfamily)
MTRSDFNNLVMRMSRRLYAQAYHILENQSGSEDVVQDVFMKLWKMNASLDKYESVDALAVTMTKNLCLDQLRKQKFTERGTDGSFSMIRNEESSPHEALERNETVTIIENIIGNLPEIYREIIRLKDIDGFSYEEIARKTLTNINTLRVNLSRARKMVREEFIKYSYEKRGNKAASRKVL